MKNNMKKIIVGIFSFALLFVAQNAFAATWNGASNDCKSISIVNATTGQGFQNPCWPNSSVSAKAGDVINVRIYYHNTGTVTASNTHLVLSPSVSLGTSGTTKSFYGRITSDNGSISFGPVTANISSSQSLSFISAKWYTNNTSETLTSLLSGQSGEEVMTDEGLYIGDIASGWPTQGSLVVAFRVSNNTTPDPTPTCSIKNFDVNGSSSTTINQGNSATLSWTTSNCKSVSINKFGDVNGSDSKTVSPSSDTTYVLTADGLTRSVTVNITATTPNPTKYCSINYFNASPDTLYGSGYSTLSWSTSNCTNVTISNLGYSVPTSSSGQKVWLSNTKSYTLDAYDNYGTHKSDSLTIEVRNSTYSDDECRITNFDADDTSIEEGDTTRLTWTTEDCNYVSISGVGSNLSRNGSYRVEPSSTKTYTLKAYGDNGNDSDTLKIYVDENNNYYDDNEDETPSVSTYYPTSIGTDRATLSGYADGNGSRVNTWIEFPCYGSRYGQSNNRSSGKITASVYNLRSNSNYSYCAVAQNVNTGRIVRGSTVSFTTDGGGYINNVNSCAVTTVATNIGQSNAQLNGIITNSDGGNVYFEYGPTASLGYKTNSRYVSGNTNFNEYISGLSSSTIYFFRMVADCGNSLSNGSIETFETDGIQKTVNTVKTVYVKQGTTVVAAKSPVMLTISNKYKAIAAGDLVDYVVTYKNIGTVTLLKPMVQVVLPTNMTLVNSSRGTYSVDTHTLSAQVEDLVPGQEGAIYLQSKVDSIPLNNSQIPTTAILIYTSATGSQENVMAYVVNTPNASDVVVVDGESDQTSTLGGAALFGSMSSIGLIGWLIIILLILILVLIVRSVYSGNSQNTPHTPSH